MDKLPDHLLWAICDSHLGIISVVKLSVTSKSMREALGKYMASRKSARICKIIEFGRPGIALLPRAIITVSFFTHEDTMPTITWPRYPQALYIYIDTVNKDAMDVVKRVVAKNCPRPHAVYISVAHGITIDEGKARGLSRVLDDASLAEFACHASSVILVNCDAVTDIGMRCLRSCRNLRTNHCNGFTSSSINELAYGMNGSLLIANLQWGHPSLRTWMQAQKKYIPESYHNITIT